MPMLRALAWGSIPSSFVFPESPEEIARSFPSVVLAQTTRPKASVNSKRSRR